MASVSMKGPYTYGTNTPVYNVWHSKEPRDRGAVLSATGTFNAARDSNNPSKINISASITITGENDRVSFGFPLWFYVKANGTTIHTWTSEGNLGISGKGSSWSKNFSSFTYTTNSAVDLSFQVHCAAGTGTGTSESGTCDQGYSYVNLINNNGSTTLIKIAEYNPWSDPTPATNVKCKINNNVVSEVKPDSQVTITWTAGKAGTGNSIGYYSVNYNRYRNGSWSGRSALISDAGGTSYNYNLDNLPLRPGDIIRFDVDTYINVDSGVSGRTSGWWYGNDTQNSGNINVYKDGIIYYKTSNGEVKECTKVYYKDGNGNLKKPRYAYINNNGNLKIIDIYTSKYE